MNEDTVKGQWKQWVGNLKKTWARFRHDELLAIEADGERLTGLIQQRYGATRSQVHTAQSCAQSGRAPLNRIGS